MRSARIAAVFQEPRLLPWRTVEQNIRLALPPPLADKDLTPILDAVELTGFRNSFPSELSLGMARRAALARAFSVEPEILLLDEPFVSLDEVTANRLRQLLIDLWRSSPVTVLMVTHNVREAARLADRLIILSPRPAHVVGVVDVPLPRERAPRRGARCAAPGSCGALSESDAGVGEWSLQMAMTCGPCVRSDGAGSSA